MTDEIIPGIFRIPHHWVDGNNGVVFGEKRAVAIDAGAFPEDGQAAAELIRSRGFAPDRLILTHGHVDHVRGGAAFAGAEIFAHAHTPDVIRAQLPGWAAQEGRTVEEEAARTVWPTVLFQQDLTLELGGRTLRLFPAPGHSRDGICVYLPQERLLFAGDSVATGIAPALNDGDSREMEASIRRLRQMEVDILVPGHGPLLRGAEAVQQWLSWLLDYLTGVRARVQDGLARGDAPAAIADGVSYERFIGERLPRAQHNQPKRHRMAVEKIITEEQVRNE